MPDLRAVLLNIMSKYDLSDVEQKSKMLDDMCATLLQTFDIRKASRTD